MMTVRPLTIRAAILLVASLHRHLPRIQGGCFATAVYDGERLCGVGIAGLPRARLAMDGKTIEIHRVATDGTQNACSKLYGALCRAAQAIGYSRALTSTLPEESGVSPRAAGFTLAHQTQGGGWSRPSRSRGAPVKGGAKLVWEKTL